MSLRAPGLILWLVSEYESKKRKVGEGRWPPLSRHTVSEQGHAQRPSHSTFPFCTEMEHDQLRSCNVSANIKSTGPGVGSDIESEREWGSRIIFARRGMFFLGKWTWLRWNSLSSIFHGLNVRYLETFKSRHSKKVDYDDLTQGRRCGQAIEL